MRKLKMGSNSSNEAEMAASSESELQHGSNSNGDRQLAANSRHQDNINFSFPSSLSSSTLLVCLFSIITTLLTVPTGALAFAAYEEEDLCMDRSCYPATGNLLIGRKHKLFASSTCGLRERQRYCIVSHLEDDHKCFWCDSRQPWSPGGQGRYSHRIENVVKENYEERTRNWWQSENGMQNISIRFDLEAEFHFTHLIMIFRSFRPAAMFIERSKDFGKTWSIYRYFAYDCTGSFPGIPEGPPRNHSDVICTRKYSDVAPSTGGELVYKVISPHIPTEDPYAPEIAELLKITNLRINFTKLHTLGDDLLDYRPEIDEKYWYAVYELVVRGSCSCYGHAQRCVPVGDEPPQSAKLPDMVHGKCECTHNTMGLNCDECQDFYNDSPWRAGIGEQSNECRRCECNEHATRCHFDWAVYNATGFVSGGVCDDCQHNTMGKNCEQCKPYFYRDPQRTLRDPYVCRPCQCDRRGSKYDGICEGEEDPERGLVAGKCYCKNNVDGPNCDRCRNGFWDMRGEDLDGCRPCSCNLIGTWGNEGCDKVTGQCTCKPLVVGDSCDHCLPQHYGLSSEDANGCKPCDCDAGGAYDNNCDLAEGQCRCRPNYSGRRCNTTESGFYCTNIDRYTFEAEHSILPPNAEQVPREVAVDRPWTWTGEGFVRVREHSNLSFVVENLLKTGHYNLVLRYEMDPEDVVGWEDVKLSVVRPGDPSPDSICANIVPSDDFLIARLPPRSRYTEVYPAICLESGVSYEIRVYFGDKRAGYPDIAAQALVDSLVVVPPTDSLDIFQGSEMNLYQKQIYDRFQCRSLSLQRTPAEQMPVQCLQFVCQMNGIIFGEAHSCECDLTGSISGICAPQGGQCECKPNVVGRRCDRCAVGTFGFGPAGCSPCDCDSVGALSNACDKQSGQCECRERGITGRQCNQCQPGFWNFPECRTCQCNGHASICDQRTGACIDCRNLTDGAHCERCVDGYYGDPRLGVGIPCKACPCPGGPGSGFQHADTCYISPQNQTVVCNCRHGYIGRYCDECEVNFWGNPREIGGSCEKCDCHGNIDFNEPGSCDPASGDCVKCMYNTVGDQCQHCQDGFFGDARVRQCARCVCNHLGSNQTAGSCDRISGQCPCFPNVVGLQCDQCAPLHYDLASGKGCSACGCDPNGLIPDPNAGGEPYLKCNDIDGQCHCKQGRGGRTCSDCQDFYWGDPVHGECQRCECDPYGSTTLQCHRQNGTCLCKPGSGGAKCNECARGYTGQWPHCQACGECFDNWDAILQTLRADLELLVDRANNIEDTGISSEYDDSFVQMETQIAEVKRQLEAVNITKEDIDQLRRQMDSLQSKIDVTRELLSEKNQRVTRVSTEVNLAEQQIKELNESSRKIAQLADNLTAKADLIRRSDTKGAAEIVEESNRRSADAERHITQQLELISQSETDRLRAEQLLNEHKQDFDRQYEENRAKLEDIGETISTISSAIPALNLEVCGAESAECDPICGGPGAKCGHCGGGSSCQGSVSKAAQAQEFASEAMEKVQAKQREAEEILKNVREVLPQTQEARRLTEQALETAKAEAAHINQTRNALAAQINETRAFLDMEKHRPEDIRAKIDHVLQIAIPFNEEQIRQLSENIRQKVAEATDTNQILEETRGNKTTALNLQQSAERASQRASAIHNTTLNIKEALEKATPAQEKAQATLDEVNASIGQIKSSLSGTEEQVASLEGKANEAADRIRKLQNITDHLKAEYIKITSNSKSAGQSAAHAVEVVKDVEQKHAQLKDTYDKVLALLEEKESGNEERKQRAEQLRKRTTELLAKIKRSRQEKNSLIERADTLDVELSSFRTTIEQLSQQIEQVTVEIDRRVEYHATCDA